MNFGQMIYNLIRKKLGKIDINSSARNYRHGSSDSIMPFECKVIYLWTSLSFYTASHILRAPVTSHQRDATPV